MMNKVPQRLWATVVLVAGLLAGCGGGGSDSSSTHITTTSPSGLISGGALTIGAGGDDADKAIRPEDFHLHDMQGFLGPWKQSYAVASLKLLISALGPKKLLDHLEKFSNESQNADERAAAGQFIDIIHKAYNSGSFVDTRPFIESLQNLAPFNQRNAAGELEFKLESADPFTENPPEPFLLRISQLFGLDSLAGWSFGVQETYVHQGEERVKNCAHNRFQMFGSVDLTQVKPENVAGLTLQKAMDLLHADGNALVKWRADDASPTAVKVIRQINIPDVENLQRLTVSFQGGLPSKVYVSLIDQVTLPATDQKTGQKLLLTLSVKESIQRGYRDHVNLIKNHAGAWLRHDGTRVSPATAFGHDDVILLINFAVKSIAPAP